MREKLPVIFLDVDGVLNSRDWYRSQRDYSDDRRHFDPAAVSRLNSLVDRTGAQIVVSSTWRKHFKRLVEMREFFASVGVRGSIVDRTPNSTEEGLADLIESKTPYARPERIFRGHEIHAWLLKNERRHTGRFVILDDDSDMEWLTPQLVNTDHDLGLTDADVELAVQFLNRDPLLLSPEHSKSWKK